MGARKRVKWRGGRDSDGEKTKKEQTEKREMRKGELRRNVKWSGK